MSHKLRNISIALLIIGGFVWWQFVYVDVGASCRIIIAPSLLEFNNTTIKEALQLLKFGDPDNYTFVCQRVNYINPNFACGGTLQGGCFRQPRDGEGGKRIEVSTANKDVLWTSSIIVHEACHVAQYLESRSYDETECYDRGYASERNIIDAYNPFSI